MPIPIITKIKEPPYKLNVGCGKNILDDWINVDRTYSPKIDLVCDLENAQIDLPDESVKLFLLSHVLEHIRNSLGLMSELYRLAEPNAVMIIKVPHGFNDEAWEDQTHVRAYFPGSFRYFSQPLYWRADYDYNADWQPDLIQLVVDKNRFENMDIKDAYEIVNRERNVVKEMICGMIAIKPEREKNKDLIVNTRIVLTLME